MDPITIVVLTTVVLGLFVACWPWLLDLMSRWFIPWLRSRLGDRYADELADFVLWLDNKLGYVRKSVRGAYRFLKTRVLGMKTTYTKTSSTTATATTETFVSTDDGKVLRRVETEDVPWQDLPSEIRSEMIRQNAARGVWDVREVLCRKAEEKASEEGIVLTVGSAPTV